MDTSSFDRIARTLGSATSRRTGLALAAAGLLGRVGSAVAVPRPAGPCKATRRPDNICTKDSDCCTGSCNVNPGQGNKDGKGRCRCIRKGGDCTVDNNCCSRGGQQMTCNDGVCGVEPVCLPLQAVCDPNNDTCCVGGCTVPPPVASVSPQGAVAVTCCIQANGTGCSDNLDCCGGGAGIVCSQGTCLLT